MSKVNLFISILFIFAIDKVQSQDVNFLPPVDHPIILAGSFGEIRSTHFHAGLDIKPSSKSAIDTIIASEMGYVSRVKVNRSGYGRAVYLDHPNGYTTVYAHLHSFAPKLQKYVLSMQRAAESYEIDIYPNPGEIIFDRGSQIGILGNSGRSYGPHLHYEIRETVSEEPINPILFGIGPVDTIPPTITSFIVHSLNHKFEVLQRKSFAKTSIPESIKIKGWRAGVGIAGFDQMNGAVNKNGIYETRLFIDDTLYYRQHLDRVSFYQMNQIKAHIDYSTKVNDKVTYALQYKAPGNNLMIIDSIRNNGLIRLYASKARQLKLVTKDLSGNETTIKTSLVRDTNSLEINSSTFNLLAKYDLGGQVKSGSASLAIPPYALAHQVINIPTSSP